MTDSYVYLIVALLPLSASMVVFQVNPYHALVIRGILGAIAALVYALLGAADVALTEALVGTMLAITLYAVAVRSSMVVRLGVLKDESNEADGEGDRHFGQLLDDLRAILSKRHVRLELIPYKDTQDLQQALMEKEVHATCERSPDCDGGVYGEEKQPDCIVTRVQRIYDIMQTELSTPATKLIYVSTPDAGEKH
jgi:putative multicomponent Na+:H+ antiporter subunit B